MSQMFINDIDTTRKYCLQSFYTLLFTFFTIYKTPIQLKYMDVMYLFYSLLFHIKKRVNGEGLRQILAMPNPFVLNNDMYLLTA